MISEKEIIEIESKLLEKNVYFVFLNKVNGTSVDAIFTSQSDANKYKIRECINLTLDCYLGSIDDGDDCKGDEWKIDDFKEILNENLTLYEIGNLDKQPLDIKKPIYVIQNGNYQVYGEPEEYLTNNYSRWKDKTKDTNNKLFEKSCIVRVNPKLSELKKFE
jgi:hypothetical protein